MPAEALCIELPTLIKARPDLGERVVEVEASNEVVDSEGDVILQAALLGSAKAFVAKGHIDIDHISEIGARYGIRDVDSWRIGRPLDVKDAGGGRTSVVLELNESRKAADILGDLKAGSGEWRSSIYGFPTSDGLVDASFAKCAEAPTATRYVVKSIDWRSLALTKRPVNDNIVGAARLLSAKAFAKARLDPALMSEIARTEMGKAEPITSVGNWLYPPRNRLELLGQYTHHIANGKCQYSGPNSELGSSVAGFRDHFALCCCQDTDSADFQALALMQLLKRERSST